MANLRLKVKNDNRIGYLYILPVLFFMVGLRAWPLINGFYISLFRTNLVNIFKFVGLQNYKTVLLSKSFYSSIFLTIKFTFFVVLGHFVLGFFLSHLLNGKLRFTTFFRAIFVIPWLIPESVIAMIFKWLINPIYGLLNSVLMQLSLISEPVSWLGNGTSAFWIAVFVCVWKGYPMVMIMLLAGMQSIDRDLYEASSIDGASPLKQFLFVTLPSMKGVITSTLILDVILWFKHYTIVWVLTQGGPGSSTSIISLEVYRRSFEYSEFGRASSLAILIFIIIMATSKIMDKAFNKNEE